MDSFSSSATTARLFPSSRSLSPTARLLSSGMDAEGLEAALAAGWISPDGMLELVDGSPALSHWVGLPRFASPLNTPGMPSPWPIGEGADWSKIDAAETTAMVNPAFNLSAQAQWVMGACVAIAPDGLGQLSWTVSEGPENGCSFLSLAVERGWTSVVDQILRRPDAPTPQQIARMRVSYMASVWSLADGTNYPTRRNIFSPLLHHALSLDILHTARRLIDSGVDVHQMDETGVPAWYHVASVESLELVLANGLSADRVFECPVPVGSWWSAVLGSVSAAEPLLARFNRWLDTSLPSEVRNPQVLSGIARGLKSVSLASLKSQLKSAKLKPSGTWEENGRQWGLATHALASSACMATQMSSLSSEPVFLWALRQGRLATLPKVWPGVENLDALWWISGSWPKARQLWESHDTSTPNTLPGVTAWVSNLIEWAQEEKAPYGLVQSVNAKENLILNAWNAFGCLPDALIHSASVNDLRCQVLTAGLKHCTWDTLRPLLNWCFSKAQVDHFARREVEASMWMGWGLELLGTGKEADLLGAQQPSSASMGLKRLLEGEQGPHRPELRQLARNHKIVCELLSDGLVPLPPPEAKPLSALLDRWSASPALSLLVPGLRSAFWSLSMPTASSAPIRPRM